MESARGGECEDGECEGWRVRMESVRGGECKMVGVRGGECEG